MLSESAHTHTHTPTHTHASPPYTDILDNIKYTYYINIIFSDSISPGTGDSNSRLIG